MLSARNLRWSAGGRMVVDDVSIDVHRGEFLAIVGPNGSGKTSLIAMLAGLRKPASGSLLLSGQPMAGLSRRALAREIALVEQQAETLERMTARQAVELGRTPHLGAFGARGPEDRQIVDTALRRVDMLSMAERAWHTLSGGERQRLHIARALAQEPGLIILDEPTNHLDISHQLSLLELLHGQRGLTVIAALHDLNHAAQFADRLAVMREGRLVTCGRPGDVLTPDLIRSVFGVTAEVETDAGGSTRVLFIRQRQGGHSAPPALRQAG